jgi:hypothetical protein
MATLLNTVDERGVTAVDFIRNRILLFLAVKTNPRIFKETEHDQYNKKREQRSSHH